MEKRLYRSRTDRMLWGVSPDFESTTSRIEMELKANLSRVVVK